jgi:hypothetical protein
VVVTIFLEFVAAVGLIELLETEDRIAEKVSHPAQFGWPMSGP